MSRSRSFRYLMVVWTVGALVAVIAACTPAVVTPSTGPLPSASPSTIAFSGAAQTQSVTVTQTGYSGAFTALSANTGVATVSPASGTTFTITAVAAGNTTVTFTNPSGTATSVSVVVTTTGGVISITD
jgi:hypothetical protein